MVDQQRKLHFTKSIDQVAPSQKYLPQKEAQKYAYKQLGGGLFGGPTALPELIPKEHKGNKAGFVKHLAVKFKEFMQF